MSFASVVPASLVCVKYFKLHKVATTAIAKLTGYLKLNKLFESCDNNMLSLALVKGNTVEGTSHLTGG